MKKTVVVGGSFLMLALIARVAVHVIHGVAQRIEHEQSYVQDGIDWLKSNG